MTFYTFKGTLGNVLRAITEMPPTDKAYVVKTIWVTNNGVAETEVSIVIMDYHDTAEVIKTSIPGKNLTGSVENYLLLTGLDIVLGSGVCLYGASDIETCECLVTVVERDE